MFSSPRKDIQENLILESSNNKRRSSKLIQRIKINQSLNKQKLLKSTKQSDLIVKKPRRNSDIELKYLKLKLEENEDLIDLPNTKKLILLITQLNGAHLINANNSKIAPENNILTIMKEFLNLLENYNFFYYFFCHYNIPKETIIKIIPYIKYEFFKKNQIICKEGETCSKFYFLLKGKISFNKKSMNGGKEEIFIKEEEGFHFGEFEIMNNRNNNYTAISLENCYLISIDKAIFIRYIQDKYIKVGIEIKSYLMNNLKNYLKMPYIKLERFIKSNIKILFFRKNDVLFKKGEETKYLYLIYNGEVNIKIKDFDKGEESSFISGKKNVSIESIQKNAKNINYIKMFKKSIKRDEESKKELKLEMALNKNKYNTVATLSKGCLIGLEISTGINFFKYNYVCKSDFTSIFEINIGNLYFHLKELMIILIPYYFELDEKIRKQVDKITLLNYKIQPKTFQKIRTRNRDKKYKKYFDSLKIEENAKTLMKQIRKIDENFDKNEAGFIKINNNNIVLQNKKNVLINKLRDEYFKSKTQDLVIHNLNQERNKNIKYNNVKMINYTANKNNSCLIGKKRPLSFYISKFKKEKRIGILHSPNKYSNKKIFSRLKRWSAKSCGNFPKNIKNYNLYEEEQKNHYEKKINSMKNNRLKFSNYINLQRKRNRSEINNFKTGLSLDCKTLVKKVCIRYNDGNNIQFNSFTNLDNKSMNFKNKSYEKILTPSKIMKNKFIVKSVSKEKNKKIIRYNEKELDFYDTGIFDMPLAIHLGAKSQKNILK